MPSVPSAKTGELSSRDLHHNLALLVGGYSELDPQFDQELEGYGLYQGTLEVHQLWENLPPEFALNVFRQKNPDLDLKLLRNLDRLTKDQAHEFALGVVRSLLNL